LISAGALAVRIVARLERGVGRRGQGARRQELGLDVHRARHEDLHGEPASLPMVVQVAPACGDYSAGNGGTGTLAARNGYQGCSAPCNLTGLKGGGGGAAGRVSIKTLGGSPTISGSPVLSAAISTARLSPR
jgi:hypothetical protein